MEIVRFGDLNRLDALWKAFSAVAILGPRQCGKTTLARQEVRRIKSRPVHVFDLENPRDLDRLEQPMVALEDLTGTIVLDEIQRRPELFPVLRVLIDRNPKTRFLILGSASRDLIRQASESLAGRIGFLELGGFDLALAGSDRTDRLWTRGGFPRSYLAPSQQASLLWRTDFISTFLERDIPSFGFTIAPKVLRRFWTMIAHCHGGIFDASELGRSLGIADTTAKRHLDLLAGTFMVRQLQPWFTNTKKRLVKRPKIFIRDTGILHSLLGIDSKNDLLAHPKLGASWEGFAIEQVIRALNLREEEVNFWALHSGAEIDLVWRRRGRLHAAEVKFSDTPRITPSIRSAIAELDLARVSVVHPGRDSYKLGPKVQAVSIRDLASIAD